MADFQIGSLVRCREREWIVLPSEQPDVLLLRPLGGSPAETCGIFLPLEGDRIEPAAFDWPDPALVGDFLAGRLLRDAARLSLRSGAGPFRSLGRLGARPRPYQLVPLIMALRLDPVRLLIADDVGIGKTIEAGLIMRELFDRGEIRRMAVLCPPHLCEQWQRELATKFALPAVIVRSGTVAALERDLSGDAGIFEHYPITIVSIDYIKSDLHRAAFIQHCPELVVVDEAHTAARPGGRAATQQQRYDLVRAVAADPQRHLLLLTATPHSGIAAAFQSLLGLLDQRFESFDLEHLSEQQRSQLAQHLVQRRRGDVQQWLGEETPFPRRESDEQTYALPTGSAYRQLFDDVFAFARELVRDQHAASHTAQRARFRYWAALALLRCVMSSPAAAEKALAARAERASPADDLFGDEDLLTNAIFDRANQDAAQDVEPTQAVEKGSPASELRRLRAFAERASQLRGDHDPKLLALLARVDALVRAGFNPIVYCRYIATANYVAEELNQRLKGFRDGRIIAVTGERSEEERELLVAELAAYPRRILVATDCLSEGINLQHAFDAVIHYDLPWNPNRLEQREGRVDRYGQARDTVRTLVLYGADNPIDQAVMKVLLRKAVSIHRSLGIAVPLPINSDTVLQSLVDALFEHAPAQLSLFDSRSLDLADLAAVEPQVDEAWDQDVERERASRTRFAQRTIKPDEVAAALHESDAVLGDRATVRSFVRAACARLDAPLTPQPLAGDDVWLLRLDHLPQPVRERMDGLERSARRSSSELLLTFEDVAPAEITPVGRNHPLTAALADFLLETALVPGDLPPAAARAGVLRSAAVSGRTVLLVLRIRMLIASPKQTTAAILAEELVVVGVGGTPQQPAWLDQPQALQLLEHAADAPSTPLSERERQGFVREARDLLAQLDQHLNTIAAAHAERLRAAHQRVRSATRAGRVSVSAHLPPDVLGLYVLVPPLPF